MCGNFLGRSGEIMNLKSIGIVVALILIMFMSAIETSIVSLALPTIKHNFNAGGLASLVFAVYFIAIVIANPIVGEALDRLKISYITIFGLLLFSIGSLFSGLSGSFSMLIISRFVQGLGAGVMMALSQIVPKLAFEIPLRYKIMGTVGSVWGISSIVGPLLGGTILQFLSWHWLFFINLPIAAIAIILVLLTFHFKNETNASKTDRKLDVKGMTVFYIMIFAFLFAVMNKEHLILNLFSIIITIIIGYILYRYEKSLNKPFIPVTEFNKTIVVIFATDFIYAMILMGYNIYMPVYLQEQLHLSPLQSGFVVFPISIAWLILNFSLDKLELKFSRRGLYLFAFTLLIICGVLILLVKEIPLFIAFSLLLAGVSFGTVYTKDSVITQEETSPQHMKRMMSLYTLTKSLGSSIGSTVMGYVYYLSLSFVKFNIYNVIMLTFVLLISLVILWLVTQHKESMR